MSRHDFFIYICSSAHCFVSGIRAYYKCKTGHSYSKFYIFFPFHVEANLFVFDPHHDKSPESLQISLALLILFPLPSLSSFIRPDQSPLSTNLCTINNYLLINDIQKISFCITNYLFLWEI